MAGSIACREEEYIEDSSILINAHGSYRRIRSQYTTSMENTSGMDLYVVPVIAFFVPVCSGLSFHCRLFKKVTALRFKLEISSSTLYTLPITFAALSTRWKWIRVVCACSDA